MRTTFRWKPDSFLGELPLGLDACESSSRQDSLEGSTLPLHYYIGDSQTLAAVDTEARELAALTAGRYSEVEALQQVCFVIIPCSTTERDFMHDSPPLKKKKRRWTLY